MNEKADPYNHEQRWLQWKKDPKIITRYGNPISKTNQDLIIEYLLDMEAGYNSKKKGKLSYIRLNTLRQRIIWVISTLNMPDIRKVTRRELLTFFNKMASGEITRRDGKKYRSVTDYIKVFKAFWHWFQRRELEYDRIIKDVTVDLAVDRNSESEFVYFTIDELKKTVNHCKFEYRVYSWFLFDSGIRSPTEFMSLKIGDFHWIDDKKIYELDIKDSYAKTFGRKIKLVLSSQLLYEFIQDKKADEPFFQLDWRSFCRYLKRMFVKILGDKPTKGGKSFGEIRPYDFRHSSACYWRVKYKKESAYMYRFGWKKMRMVDYYTKFLGMKDTITQNDLLIDSEAKSKLEIELEQERKTRIMMEERMQAQEKQLNEVNDKFEKINSVLNLLVEKDPSLIDTLAAKAKAFNINSGAA